MKSVDLDAKLTGVVAELIRQREERADAAQTESPAAAQASGSTASPERGAAPAAHSPRPGSRNITSPSDRRERLSTFKDTDKQRADSRELAEHLSSADLMIDFAKTDRKRRGDTQEREIDNRGEDLKMDRIKREKARRDALNICLSPMHSVPMANTLGAPPPTQGLPATSPMFYPMWSEKQAVDKILEQQARERVGEMRSDVESAIASTQLESSAPMGAYRDRVLEEHGRNQRRLEEERRNLRKAEERRLEEAARLRRAEASDVDGPDPLPIPAVSPRSFEGGGSYGGPQDTRRGDDDRVRETRRGDDDRPRETRRADDDRPSRDRSTKVFEERRADERRAEETRASEDLARRRVEEEMAARAMDSVRTAEDNAARLMAERIAEERRFEEIRAAERLAADRNRD